MQTLSEVNQGLRRLEVYYTGLKLKLLSFFHFMVRITFFEKHEPFQVS